MSNVKDKTELGSATFSNLNKIVRILWSLIYFVFFRFSPVPFFGYRRLILKIFGCQIAEGVRVYPNVKIWLPSNLQLGANTCLGPGAIIYNQGRISIGDRVIISQNTHLCASTHDYNDCYHPLVLAPITIEDNVWVCTDAFVAPNVQLSEGCVIGARAVITKNAEPWSIYAGNPAQKIKNRNRF